MTRDGVGGIGHAGAVARVGLRAPRIAGGLPPSALGWLAVAVVAAGALVPILRLPVLGIVAGVALVSLAARPGRPTGPAAAWIAVLPIAAGLAVGLLPDPRVTDPTTCDDVLAGPVLRRVAQAAAVLGTVAVLAPRMGGWRSLGFVMPPDRRVVVLAALCPVLVPIAYVVGPILAEPFFGTVVIDIPGPAALLPAGVLAIANATLEETAYRGAVQRWAAPALGVRGAVVAQALIFGCGHQGTDIEAGAILIVGGLVLAGIVAGVVAHVTRSLLLPIAAHAAIDIPVALALTCRLA